MKCRQCGECCRTLKHADGEYEVEGNRLIIIKDGVCQYLIDNKCSIHESKPLVCKLYFCE